MAIAALLCRSGCWIYDKNEKMYCSGIYIFSKLVCPFLSYISHRPWYSFIADANLLLES